MSQVDILVVGRLGRTHGVRGCLKVISSTNPPENIFTYRPWYLHRNNRWEKVSIDETLSRPESYIIKLTECKDREHAQQYTGLEIGVERTQLPVLPMGEYYWVDLIGLSIINQTGATLGTLKDFLETGSADVMVIQGEKEYLIPYMPDLYVIEIDLEKKIMRVDWDA